MYVLQPLTGKNAVNDIILGICSTRREVLDQFIKTATYNSGNSNKRLSESYTITNGLYTMEEATQFFGVSFSTCLFLDSEIASLLGGYAGTYFEDMISSTGTKYSTTQDDVNSYLAGGGVGISDLDILGYIPNVVPLSLQRSI